jgi:hypothetical protein
MYVSLEILYAGLYVRIMCKQCISHTSHILFKCRSYGGENMALYAECMRNVCGMYVRLESLGNYWKLYQEAGSMFSTLHYTKINYVTPCSTDVHVTIRVCLGIPVYK